MTKAIPALFGSALMLLALATQGEPLTDDTKGAAPGTAAGTTGNPAPSGEDADESAKEPPPPPTPEQQRYLDAVQALEAQGGAYDAALSEQLLGLGAAYQTAGRHEQAAEALSRAAHIVRVNEGLYSPSDLPILERLIESYSALGEWDGVGSSYQQMFQIHRRNYGESDERMLPALQRLSAWHLSAYLGEIGEDPINHLEAARNLYDSSLGILQARPAGDPRLPDALREKAIVDYYLASYMPTGNGGMSFSAGPSNGQQQAGPAYALIGFSSGREALEKVVELRKQDPAAGPLARGQAAAELGDWHQLFNRRQTALDLYKEAWTQAAVDGSNQAVNQIFGQPIALPVLPQGLATIADASAGAPGSQALIVVSFAVNERGLVEDIRVVGPEPSPAPPVAAVAAAATGSEGAAATTPKAVTPEETPEQKAAAQQTDKLKKRLRATRFRPRFEAGLPVPTPDITYTYRYSL